MSWDRRCPIFQHKCDELNEQLEDNKLPYFPMSEGWTQVCEPPKVIYMMPPPSHSTAPLQGSRLGGAHREGRVNPWVPQPNLYPYPTG